MSSEKSYTIDLLETIGAINGGMQAEAEIPVTAEGLGEFIDINKQGGRETAKSESPAQDETPVFDQSLFAVSTSHTAQKIIRTHFIGKILTLTETIKKDHVENRFTSSNAIASLFKYIITFCKFNQSDPFAGYLLALYDGLSYETRWMSLSRAQYGLIHNQIKSMAKRNLDHEVITKEIFKLEGMGINTTPYGG